MRRSLLVLLLAALLPACSQQLLRGGEGLQPGLDTDPAQPMVGQVERYQRELIYLLLVGEFAEQQGDFATASSSYLRAAHLSDDPSLARQATRVAVFTQDYALIEECAELWVALDAEDLDARQSLAALLLRNGEPELARPHLEKVIELAGPEEGFLAIAAVLSRQPDKEQGLAMLDELAKPWPKQREAHYAMAYLAAESGRYQRSLAALDRLDRLSPDWPKALILRANVQSASGDAEAALTTLAHTVKLLPDDYSLRLSYARMLVKQRRLREARTQYTLLAKARPDSGDALYAVALLAMQAGDLGTAERYLKRLLSLEPYADQARYMLGEVAEERGRPRDAIDWYQRVGAGDHYLDSRFRVADLLAREQGLAAGRGYLKSVVVTQPEDEVSIALAEAELVSEYGEVSEAIRVLDKALEVHTEHEDLLYSRAMYAERMGRIDLLERDLQRILRQDPDNARALNALGFTLADRTERYAEAQRYIEQAYKLEPEDAAIIDSMGWVLYRLGRYDEAIGFLRRALDKLSDGEIAAHLGEVLWAAGRRAEAREVFAEARRKHPDNPVLLRTLKRLGL